MISSELLSLNGWYIGFRNGSYIQDWSGYLSQRPNIKVVLRPGQVRFLNRFPHVRTFIYSLKLFIFTGIENVTAVYKDKILSISDNL